MSGHLQPFPYEAVFLNLELLPYKKFNNSEGIDTDK